MSSKINNKVKFLSTILLLNCLTITKSDVKISEPLILTPLIKANQIEEALSASRVQSTPILHDTESYSGFLTVNEKFNGNLFFWFFPSENNFSEDPVVLWLQGGPGASSMLGLFQENGPFQINKDLVVELREHSWNKNHSVLYIDNPVGTGFSFSNGGYCENQTCIAENLYECLQQFFCLFPELRSNEFFVSGESYAGKYVPAIGYKILTTNQESESKINLKGLAIGNGIVDPLNQLYYNEYVYELGLVDSETKTKMSVLENQAHEFIKLGNYGKAFEIMQEVMMNRDTVFSRAAGPINVYNYLKPIQTETPYLRFLNKTEVREAIYVGGLNFQTDSQVETCLNDDIMKSVAPWLSELLNAYRVLIYNGQLDIVAAYPLTLKYLEKLKFSGAEDYFRARRFQWYVEDDLAGYFKRAGNLSEVLVRNAGHMVPEDQPKWAYTLLMNFTHNVPLSVF